MSSKHKFTKSELAILTYITANQGEPISKKRIAKDIEFDIRTIDRCIVNLKNKGVISVKANYSPNGGRLASSYYIVSKAESRESIQDNIDPEDENRFVTFAEMKQFVEKRLKEKSE